MVTKRNKDGLQSAAEAAAQSTLESRNVQVVDRASGQAKRTSLRLEPQMWDALQEIAQREESSLNAIVSRIEQRRTASTLTAAVRVFIVSYFRAAATEAGHAGAGHGTRRLPRGR